MMIKALAATLLCGALLSPVPGMAAEPGQTAIYASGQATVSAPPDVATISFNINTHAQTAEQATSENNTIYAHFNTGMRTIGITAAEVKTTGYSLNHVPPPPPCPPMPMQSRTAPNAEFAQAAPCVRDPQSYGYFVSRSVNVTTHHLDIVGKIIDTAVAAGVNNVGGVEYAIGNTRSLYLRALAQAIASARSEGDVMAQAAGLHIVKVQSIGTPGAVPVVEAAGRFMPRAALDTYGAPTQISPPSSLDVTANVSVTYLAQP